MKPLPKIKPCPFCGHKKPRLGGVYRAFVVCKKTNCAHGPWRRTKRGAINAWNKRHAVDKKGE